MKNLLLLCALALAGGTMGADPWERELIPADMKKPLVFTSQPGEFARPSDARSVSFPVDGAKMCADAVPPSDLNGAVRIRIRATTPQTEAVEFTLLQSDGKVWGHGEFPISTEWADLLVPYSGLQYFRHWGNMPSLKDGEELNERLLKEFRFCFGAWLCRSTINQAHGFEVASVKLVRLAPGTLGDGKDHSLDEFPRLAGETDDTARFQRAVNATPNGVLTVPRGVYAISSTIRVNNLCSFDLNKSAVLKAVAPMRSVMFIDGRDGIVRHDYNVFFRGGVIDGMGLASCLNVKNFAHYTIRDCTLLNGKDYGLRVDGGYEVVANNVYCKCKRPGLAGNSGFYINGGDSHYTDCIVVDYTIGFNLKGGGANRLTRCHVWGGPIPPPKPGELPEMLKGSINFNIESSATILRDCYADTGEIGYYVNGWDTRLLGCHYYNNNGFKLDHITIIKHLRGRLLVADGEFSKTAPHYTVYDGCGEVEWRNMIYDGFGPEDDCPGALTFKKATPRK